MPSSSLCRALFAGAFSLISAAAAAGPYTITVIAYPKAVETYPLAQNAAGTVVGYWFDSKYVQHGFTYQGGKLTDLDPPGAAQSSTTGIDDKGDITGYFQDSAANTHGYLYTAATGKFSTVDLPGSGVTTLNGINRKGVALAFGLDSSGYGEVLTYKKGAFTVAIDDQMSPAATSLNNLGSIAGYLAPPRAKENAFIYVNGTFMLVPFGGNYYSAAFGLNSHNEVAGQFVDSDAEQYGFLYTPGGTITKVQPPGSTDAFFLAINDTGLAAGATFDASYNSLAWVYHEKTGKSVTFGIKGYTGVGAIGINNAGQVIGDCVDANSVGHTFIAVPKM